MFDSNPYHPQPDPAGPAGLTADPAQAAAPFPPAQLPGRSRRSIVLIVVGLVLFIVAGGAAVGYGLWTRGAPTQADAERECRTAVQKEFDRRVTEIEKSSTSKGVLVTVAGIDMQESRRVDSGFQVNFTVRYQATAPLVGTVPNTLALTCNAVVKDRKLTTVVVNRV